MSGSIGGKRIKRESVKGTLQDYIDNILMGFPGFVKANITGSYNTGIKKDHGDIDIVVLVKGFDLKKVKKDFKNYLDRNKSTMPKFSKGNHIGEVSQMYGSIVTCGWWIDNTDDYVQIDNIIVLSEQDMDFQTKFLNLDAAKQAIVMGLIRVILNKKNIYDLFDTSCLLKRHNNQEYEFVLSTQGLSLRLVTLDNHREIDRKEVWRSTNWMNVSMLINNIININDSYESIVNDIYNIFQYDERSLRRIVGIMKSMINIGPGEIGTQKGYNKEYAIRYAEEVLLKI